MQWFNLTIKEIALLNIKEIIPQIINEIKALNPKILNKLDFYKEYINQLSQLLNDNLVSASNITFEMVYNQYEQFIYNNTSQLFLYGHILYLYPRIRIFKASKRLTCYLTGEVISQGQEYIDFRPLLKDLNDNRAFVLDPSIKILQYHHNLLPTNILQLEDYIEKLSNPYNFGNDTYYEILCNIKEVPKIKLLGR